jgi:hypothetical protein
MDGHKFDDLIRRLTVTRLTRWDALRGLVAGAAAVTGVARVADETAAKKRGKGKGKKSNKKKNGNRQFAQQEPTTTTVAPTSTTTSTTTTTTTTTTKAPTTTTKAPTTTTKAPTTTTPKVCNRKACKEVCEKSGYCDDCDKKCARLCDDYGNMCNDPKVCKARNWHDCEFEPSYD